jgi:hypothetical protein
LSWPPALRPAPPASINPLIKGGLVTKLLTGGSYCLAAV